MHANGEQVTVRRNAAKPHAIALSLGPQHPRPLVIFPTQANLALPEDQARALVRALPERWSHQALIDCADDYYREAHLFGCQNRLI